LYGREGATERRILNIEMRNLKKLQNALELGKSMT
jgi:hypothetical protein